MLPPQPQEDQQVGGKQERGEAQQGGQGGGCQPRRAPLQLELCRASILGSRWQPRQEGHQSKEEVSVSLCRYTPDTETHDAGKAYQAHVMAMAQVTRRTNDSRKTQATAKNRQRSEAFLQRRTNGQDTHHQENAPQAPRWPPTHLGGCGHTGPGQRGRGLGN